MRRYGYGLVLIMILVSLSFQLAVTETDATQAITILLQGTILLLAVWASQSEHVVVRGIELTVASIVVVIAVLYFASGTVDDRATHVVNLMLILFAPVTIAAGVVRHVRHEGAITVRTMFGVLCIYLLIGMIFSFCYGAIEAIGSERFFSTVEKGTPNDFLYFSYATLTTTGYGDLTTTNDLGRSLAITEALIGQIYLVTVVALIVGNLGARRPASRRDA